MVGSPGTKGKTIDFLSEPSDNLRRKELRNIKDSYSHPWDVLSELLQNSVDAIRRKASAGGKNPEFAINVEVNTQTKTLRVEDNGTGFPLSKLRELLAPHGTDKPSSSNEIGQKGIGLKFAIFSCDDFSLESVGPDGYLKGAIKGASSWVDRRIGSRPLFVDTGHTSHPIERGSSSIVRLAGMDPPADESQGLFDLTADQVIVLLRTRTAVGNTRALFDIESPDIKVTLTYASPSGKKSVRPVPFRFLVPTELLKDRDRVRLADYDAKAAVLSDEQKVRMLKDKTLWDTGKIQRANRTIHWYACFVPSRPNWKRIRSSAGLPEEAGDEEGIAGSLIRDGIFVATRGMPTGIRMVPPEVGNIAFWPNMFILLEDDSLEFDLGRKSIPSRTQGMLREIAGDTFKRFAKVHLLTTGESETQTGPAEFYNQERSAAFQDFERLTNLGLPMIQYQKYPDHQEAGVVAIFHELVGAGALAAYCCLRQSYKAAYDFWGKYRIGLDRIGARVRPPSAKPNVDLPIVIEFKFEAADIIQDVDAKSKFFMDIDMIVCWDLDERRFARESIQVRPLSQDEVFYQGTNYELEWPGAFNLGPRGRKPVLALRKFIEDLRAKSGGGE